MYLIFCQFNNNKNMSEQRRLKSMKIFKKNKTQKIGKALLLVLAVAVLSSTISPSFALEIENSPDYEIYISELEQEDMEVEVFEETEVADANLNSDEYEIVDTNDGNFDSEEYVEVDVEESQDEDLEVEVNDYEEDAVEESEYVDETAQEEVIIPITHVVVNDFASLQAAINESAVDVPTTIEVASNIDFTNSINIPSNRDIILQSSDDNIWRLRQAGSDRHFRVAGSLTLQNIIIDGVDMNSLGGGIYVWNNGTLVMKSGTTVTSGHASIGGGVSLHNNSNFTMEGGIITGNTASLLGGGVGLSNSSFTMISGVINYNIAHDGGGVNVNIGSSFTMQSGAIINNTAELGGGVMVAGNGSEFIMAAGVIGHNEARDGGGVKVTLQALFTAYDGEISDNTANGNGGGIHTLSPSYANVTTSNDTIFRGNTASLAVPPPSDATTRFPNIGFASTSIGDHPLNNYDINHAAPPAVSTRTVTFNSNGGSAVESQIVDFWGFAEEPLIPTREGYRFIGWFRDNETFENQWSFTARVTVDMTLYAQWEQIEVITPPIPTFEVTFNSNGGTAVENQVVNSGATVESPTDPSRSGYTFVGWFTDNNTFENQWNFATQVTGDLTLYAQWRRNAPSRPDDEKSQAPTPQLPQTGSHVVLSPIIGILSIGLAGVLLKYKD